MGVGNIIKIMKEVHPESIILVKVGTFYYAYGRDAYILSYLFNYQIKKVETTMDLCGFPKVALERVIEKFEDESINYIIIDKRLNYEVEDESDFEEKNKYKDIYKKAHKFLIKKNKIDEIYHYLLNNINDSNIRKKLNEVEEILYEV